MGQEEDPPTNLSNHGRKGRASSPLVKYLEMGGFLSRSASDLPSFGASVSILSGGRPSFFGWQKSPFRKAKNFCAHENKFPHMRKYFFLYTEINFLIYGNFLPSARKFFALRKEAFFLPKSALFSFGRREVFLPQEIDFPPKKKSPPFEGKKPCVRREKKRRPKGKEAPYEGRFFFARTEINFLTYENIFSYVRKIIFLRTEILALRRASFLPPLKPSPSLRKSGLEKGRSEGRKSAWRKAFEAIGRYCLRCRIFAFHKSLGGPCPTSFGERPLPIKDNDAEIRYP